MTAKKHIPKGHRRGGTQFPRIPLKRAVEYAKKLVSKTHTGSQTATIILKGVFNNAGSLGKIRASALKQYDLLTGTTSAYDATELAKQINSAPPGEQMPLLQRACLKPKLFKSLFDTFQNDTVSKAKIKQQALTLGVHPDSGDEAVNIFVDSLTEAGLAHDAHGEFAISATFDAPVEQGEPSEATTTSSTLDQPDFTPEQALEKSFSTDQKRDKTTHQFSRAAGRSQMQINLTLDSTMDPEKLQKSLDLLKRYGVL